MDVGRKPLVHFYPAAYTNLRLLLKMSIGQTSDQKRRNGGEEKVVQNLINKNFLLSFHGHHYIIQSGSTVPIGNYQCTCAKHESLPHTNLPSYVNGQNANGHFKRSDSFEPWAAAAAATTVRRR